MMEIKVGEIFKPDHGHFVLKVIGVFESGALCQVIYDNKVKSKTMERKNTLFEMKRLSSLERELI